jgi:HEAT repeat protein
VTAVPWYEWWWANQWRFIRIPQRLQIATGTGEEKGQALEAVGKFLNSALKERYFDIRAAAAIALGKAGEPSALKGIRPLFKARHEVVRQSSFLAAGMLKDEKSIPLLTTILGDRRQSQALRVYAAVALGLIGSDEAGSPLLEALTTAHDKKTGMTLEIRGAAALSLGLMKYKKAVPALVKVFESTEEDHRLRAITATALGKFETPSIMLEAGEISTSSRLLSALQTTFPPQVRRAAIMALGNVWYEGLGSSLIDLHDTDPDPWVKNLSLLICAEKITNPNVKRVFHKKVRELITDSRTSLGVRNFAAVAAGLSGDTEAIGDLRSLFQRSRKEDTRAAAAVGLGFLKDVDSIPLLLDGMKSTESAFIKSFCCVSFALMEKGDPRVSAMLRALITDPKNTGLLRSCASIALAKIGDTAAVNLLLKYLGKGSGKFRKLMVISVGYFRDLGTFVPLQTLFKSPRADYETKALVLVSLGHIIEKEHPPVLKKLFLHYNYLLQFPNLSQIFRIM